MAAADGADGRDSHGNDGALHARDAGHDARTGLGSGHGGHALPEVRFAFHSAADPSLAWSVVHLYATEGMNAVYEAQIDLATEDLHVEPDALVGKRAEITIQRESLVRRIGGIVRRVEDHGSTAGKRLVRVYLVPALWHLSQRVTSRIYQDMRTVDIVRDVLADAGLYQDHFSVELQREYAPREYCVQYRESDLAFVMRLLEDEGIAFYFSHVDDDGETLVLADEPTAYGATVTMDGGPVQVRGTESEVATSESVRRFDWGLELRPTGVRLRDYDFTHPSAEADLTRMQPRRGLGDRPVYDYPADYNLYSYDGQSYQKHTGARAAEVRYQELTASERVGRGLGNVSGFTPGQTFELAGHGRPELDQRYLLLRITHEGHAPEVLTNDTQQQRTHVDRYHNEFDVVPATLPWRPARVTRKPIVEGPHTALVVGPAGEEIYTDTHGRIKVQFHWDLEGRRNEHSSVFMRVAQAWAGPGWGFVFLPRIGMEVIVQFLEGNPDRPLVVGCVYNGENTPPYPLPGDKTKSTIKSNSTPGGGGSNEIRFEDAKGGEEVYLHAQKDFNEVVENNHNTTVHANQTNSVDVDQTQTIGANQTESVGGNQTMSVSGNRTASVSGNETMSVSGNQTESVSGNRTLSVSGSDTNSVTGHQSTSVSASADMNVTGTYSVSATALYALSVGGTSVTADTSSIAGSAPASITLSVGGSSIAIEPAKITLTVGGSSVTIEPATITIHSTTVNLNADATANVGGGANLNLTGPTTDMGGTTLTIHGTTVNVNGTTTTVTGSGSSVALTGDATIAGGTVKLNS